MSSIAIITARGGSKRIPKKNIKNFCGKPIIAYSIEVALNSKCFDEVMVSTDSQEIADVAIKYGANVPFLRSEKTSNDYATTADVLKEVLEVYESKGKKFDFFCCLYPTAPFVTAVKLKNAIQVFKEAKAMSLMPVVKYSFPIQRSMIIKDGFVQYKYPEYAKTRSQDLEDCYHDCGQFYLCKTEAFFEYNTTVTPETIPFIVPEEEVQDIDNLSDWKIAEIKYKQFILEKA